MLILLLRNLMHNSPTSNSCHVMNVTPIPFSLLWMAIKQIANCNVGEWQRFYLPSLITCSMPLAGQLQHAGDSSPSQCALTTNETKNTTTDYSS